MSHSLYEFQKKIQNILDPNIWYTSIRDNFVMIGSNNCDDDIELEIKQWELDFCDSVPDLRKLIFKHIKEYDKINEWDKTRRVYAKLEKSLTAQMIWNNRSRAGLLKKVRSPFLIHG